MLGKKFLDFLALELILGPSLSTINCMVHVVILIAGCTRARLNRLLLL